MLLVISLGFMIFLTCLLLARLVYLMVLLVLLRTEEGLVRLSSNIVLSHVLYVSSLNCNLVSISQLTDNLHCIVHFDLHTCVIQD